MSAAPEAREDRLFETPDLAAIQRNWPRIALRASVLVLVPVLLALLARSLDLYKTIRGLPLPLDFLAAGPFAYEAKVVAFVAATLIGLAYLVPKRTSQIVIGVCVLGILWTGHVFITLQWARLFATTFDFREETMPGPLAWTYGALLVTVGVVYLLVENLLATRDQQGSRALAPEETRKLLEVSVRALATMLGLGLAIALVLALAYLAMRALLAQTHIPLRLNPVFVLLAMGIGLALLVALAARRRSPVGEPDEPPARERT